MVLPYVGTCFAFAMAHHVHIAPPRPYASVHVSRYGAGEGVWSGPEPPTMQALGIKDDRLKCNKDNYWSRILWSAYYRQVPME